MDTLEMFPDLPRNPTRLESWKEQYGVWTHRAHMSGYGQDWLAILVPKSHEELEEYDLTEEEKSDPMALFAGYCRLMDEAGLSQTGNTELEACQRIAQRWHLIGI